MSVFSRLTFATKNTLELLSASQSDEELVESDRDGTVSQQNTSRLSTNTKT